MRRQTVRLVTRTRTTILFATAARPPQTRLPSLESVADGEPELAPPGGRRASQEVPGADDNGCGRESSPTAPWWKRSGPAVVLLALTLSGATTYGQTKWPPDDVRPVLTSVRTDPADVIIGEPVSFPVTAEKCPLRKDPYCVPMTDSRCHEFCNGRPPNDPQACPVGPNTRCFGGRCVGPEVALYCSSDCVVDACAPKAYRFDPGDGTCPPDQPFCLDFDRSHTYRNVGPYRLRVQGFNDAGTSNTIELLVSPREVRPPVAGFTWNSSPSQVPEIVGNAIPFRSDGYVSNGVRQYLWDFGDGTTSTEANPSHVFAAADTYVVTLTVTNNVGRDTTQREISIGAKSGGSPPESASFQFTPALAITGQPVRFTDRSTGRILRWRWMFETTLGDTSLIGKAVSYEQNPSHVFTTPQRKNVELWVSNEYGRKSILLFVDVLRSDNPPIAAFSFSPVTVTVGVPVQFTDESGGATSWLWDFGESGASSTEQNPRHTYRSPGQKAVTLRVSNAFGSDTATKFFACSEGDVPTRLEALFIWSPTIPRPFEAVTFFDQSTGSPERWSWTVSDGTTSNERNWTHRFVQEGDYIVGLRVDKGSATHQFSQLVRVRSGAAPVARFTWSPISPDPGQEVRFENESQNATSFTWDFGDGGTSAERNPVHSYRDARTYTVRLAAKNAEGDEHTVTNDLIVGGREERPVALFDVSPNPARVGRPVQFTDRSTGRPTRWYWTFGHSGASSNLQNPTYTFTDTGTYTVTLIAENSAGRSDERGIGVVVRTAAKPVPRFTWTPASPRVGDTVVFTDQSENDPTGWRWTFPGGVTASGRQVSHVFTARGRFDVTLEASNDEGSSSLTQQVTVDEDLVVDFTISPEHPLVGKKTTFTDTTRGSYDRREWIVDGLVREAGMVLEHVFPSDGLHTVELRVFRGSESFIRQKQFEVAGPPLAVINYQGEVVVGREVTFNAGAKGVVTRYEWTINGSPAGSARSARTTFRGAGRSTITLRVENAAGQDTRSIKVDVRNRPSTERPNITKKEHVRFGPCVFEDRKGLSPLDQDYEIGVFWRGFTPAEIVTTLDSDTQRSYRTRATGETTAVKALMVFGPASKPAETHTVSFTAVGFRPEGTAGTAVESSDPETRSLTVFRVPDDMLGNAFGKLEEDRRIAYTYTTAIPAREIEFTRDIPKEVPLLGGYKFGITKTQWRDSHIFRTDCTSDSRTEAEGGITMAGGTISFKGYRKGGYEISQKDGIRQKSGSALGWELSGTIDRSQELGDLLGATSRICTNRFVGSICKVIEFKAFVGLTGGGEWTYEKNTVTGSIDFSDNTGLVKLSGGGSATVNGGQAILIEVGATVSGSITVGSPSTDKGYLRKADLGVEGTAKVSTYLVATDYKYAFGCTYPPTVPGDIITCGKTADALRAEPLSAELTPSALSVVPPYAARESTASAVAALEDVSPVADPAAAFHGDGTLVVYLSENGSVTNPLHRLDVRYVRRDSADAEWSRPKPITSDALGEFNPFVTFRSAAEAVAVWERNRNGSLTAGDVASLDDLGKLTRDIEIVAATYDVANDRWSAPEALTANDVWDSGPRLAVLADGRVVAAWIREAANGTQEIVSRTLAGNAWSAETVVATALRGVTGLSIAAGSNDAWAVFSHDKDGSAATADDTEIGAARLRDGAWQRVTDLTADTTSDVLPQVIYPGPAARVIWLRGSKLVWRRADGGDVEVIRDRDAPLGLVDATAVAAPGGRVAIVRADLVGTSNAAVAQLWEPATNRWSPDVPLRTSTGRGQSVSPVFLDAETIRLVMLDTTLTAGSARRTDLVAADKRLRVDLALEPSLAVSPEQPAAGQSVTVTVTAENRGALAVRDVPVSLYAGRTAEGALLATARVAGEWMPGEKKVLEIAFTHPSSLPVVTALIDAATLDDANPADNAAVYAFANRLPVPCFQASALTGAAPLDVQLDASCSSDPDGAVASYSWNIGSGAATPSGRAASHRFALPGSYPVTLLVTDDMGARSSRTVTVDVGAADRRPTSAAHSLYLPVAGRAPGAAGAYFVSDLDVLNTDADELQVEAVFMPAGRTDSFVQKFSLGGGELLRTRDVLASLFSAANGTGSIRLDLSHPHAIAAARTYNDQPSGTAGFSNAAVRRSEALADGETAVILQHWLPGYRTNLGFTEIGGQPAEVTATAYDEAGKRIGSEQYWLGPYQHQQFSSVALFQRSGRVELAVRGGTVIAYASTVDGRTGDSIYQTPQRVRPQGTAASLLVPVVARLAGANGSTWRTNVRILNSSSQSQRVTVVLRTSAGAFTKTADLDAGQTAAFDDVVGTLFPQLTGNIGGSLTITAAGPLLASSRTFNLTAAGTYGLYVPASETSALLAAGETAYLTQIQENADYRCNLGLTTADEGASVEVRAFDARGETLATKVYGVPAGTNIQIGRVLADMGVPLPVDVAGLEVRVLEGRAFAYASINDNRTGDGTFVEAAR